MYLTQAEKDFIKENLDINPDTLIFKKDKENLSFKKIAIQLKARKRIRKKLPNWYADFNLYFPPTISLEQCSSEITAIYKSEILEKGEYFADITGGFGIDTYYLSKKFNHSEYYELNEDLAKIVEYNFQNLKSNTNVYPKNGVESILKSTKKYDCIYLDPARRKNSDKVYKLEDCTPNLLEFQEKLLLKTKQLVSKHSPMVDIAYLKKELLNLSDIYIISVNNECKEILAIQNNLNFTSTKTHCIHLKNNQKEEISIPEVKIPLNINFSKEGTFLYLPNPSILKAFAQDYIANTFSFKKLNINTNVFLSDELTIDFPGRVFKVISKTSKIKDLKKLIQANKIEIICKNAHYKPDYFYKKLKLKKGSNNQFLIIGKHTEKEIVFYLTEKLK